MYVFKTQSSCLVWVPYLVSYSTALSFLARVLFDTSLLPVLLTSDCKWHYERSEVDKVTLTISCKCHWRKTWQIPFKASGRFCFWDAPCLGWKVNWSHQEPSAHDEKIYWWLIFSPVTYLHTNGWQSEGTWRHRGKIATTWRQIRSHWIQPKWRSPIPPLPSKN